MNFQSGINQFSSGASLVDRETMRKILSENRVLVDHSYRGANGPTHISRVVEPAEANRTGGTNVTRFRSEKRR